MARPPRDDAKLGFDALHIEGALLQPEWLARVARLDAEAQGESDYGVPEGLNLRDELSRYWRMAQARWSRFAAGRAQRAEPRALAEGFAVDLLSRVFGFGSLRPVPPLTQGERAFPIGHAALDGRVPVIIAPAGLGLDTLHPDFGDGGRRRSAFGLAQEALNATEGALWGLCTDGLSLRVLRDNQSLTRPAWIQADLARIFAEERFADFAALWLLLHESRVGRPGQPAPDCPLERWREAGREEGTRAREHLRRGVEQALQALGHGFIAHPDNQALRAALQSGALSERELMGQLLRLVYRLIFLLTIEERELLHPDRAPAATRALYADGYSMRRLRERAARRAAHDRHHDAWEQVRLVFRALATGEERLGLPALSGLFAPHQCPHLDAARLHNRALLGAVFKLSWLRDKAGLARVNWRDMGPEELGSVYESLLELVPRVSLERREFSFAEGDETKGHARKTTGSYYTPDSLVQVLLDSALEPVVADTVAAHPHNPVPALLRLSVVDPACGSGHFLLAAARRLAGHVARHRAQGTPGAAEYRRALREVVGRCIYGVDSNPMAVELCKVALWMEAVEPGLPLGFLDAHIRVGNALLGATPELMERGVPDAAWEPLEGDDRKTASALKKRNARERAGQRTLVSLWSRPAVGEVEQVADAVAALDAAPDEALAELRDKESRWAQILASGSYQHQKFVADAWCAAFLWPKPADGGPVVEAAPTDAVWRDLREGRGQPPELLVKTVTELAEQFQLFHWHLAFPTVFKKGGFDVVLGNPPWDQVQLDAREWFASRLASIADAEHLAARTSAIEALKSSDPGLFSAYKDAVRRNEGVQHIAHCTGRFPLTSNGRLNTAPLFCETAINIVAPHGRMAVVVPTGIATDSFTQEFFKHIVDSERLQSLFSFENEEFLFPGVHHATKFCLLTIGGKTTKVVEIDTVFFARKVSDLLTEGRLVKLTRHDFALLNPNTRTCPTFRWSRDAKILRSIHRVAPAFVVDEIGATGNPWGFRGLLMFMMNTDSGLFRSRKDFPQGSIGAARFSVDGTAYLPLIEAKMLHQFDHRFGTYEGQTEAGANQGKLPELDDRAHDNPHQETMPKYWIVEEEVDARLEGKWLRHWLLGWRDICRSTDQRTVIASVFPRSAVGHTTPVLLTDRPPVDVASLYANLCCYSLDYAARQKVGGTHLTYGYLKQLPILPPATYLATPPWLRDQPVRDWILPRVLELTYTAWDLQPFAQDCGYDGPPFRWDPARRTLLRAELDAAFFHLYGLSREDADYILETFPIVRKNDEKVHGEYRTKRLILERYDALSEAARAGRPYTTVLDPPPADPRVAHPPREEA